MFMATPDGGTRLRAQRCTQTHNSYLVRPVQKWHAARPLEDNTMPFRESTGLASHILPERLFKVAARGETFQDKELQHLENCVLCQERFHQFVRQELQERGIIPPAERKILQFPRG